MDDTLNTIRGGDCIAGLNSLPEGIANLAFADPPFNIGYTYDVYQDSLEHEHYIAWSREWITAVHRVLSDTGAFWLAIGDEYAAELKLSSQQIGFHCRSWVIWYYTFGVNCSKKFTRSHAHLFHFVKDPRNFTFREDDLENRIPSARQLVYNDKRANPLGRLPDDTWIIRPSGLVGELLPDDSQPVPEIAPPSDTNQTWTLRPQDLAECFRAAEDTWYFPRVAGTFKERAGFHGCQMPEQLLGRIIRTCSNDGDLVIDPFSGSATTLAVAKKLGRRYLGFDISEEYVRHGKSRLESIRVGDRLDGSEEPLVTAPKTADSKTRNNRRGRPPIVDSVDPRTNRQLEMTLVGVAEAFRLSHDGYSVDRVVVDPELNLHFAAACRKLGLAGEARTWNRFLFRLRKAGKLEQIETTRRTAFSWEHCDNYLFASEIALQQQLDADKASSLDEVLTDPFLAAEFDETAQRFAPGYTSLEYRWAALQLRKHAKVARDRGAALVAPSRLGKLTMVEDLDIRQIPQRSAAYLLSELTSQNLYVGETLNLRTRLETQFGAQQRTVWSEISSKIGLRFILTETQPSQMLSWQCCLVRKYNPKLNFHELRAAT